MLATRQATANASAAAEARELLCQDIDRLQKELLITSMKSLGAIPVSRIAVICCPRSPASADRAISATPRNSVRRYLLSTAQLLLPPRQGG
jgi:hypothetical protein